MTGHQHRNKRGQNCHDLSDHSDTLCICWANTTHTASCHTTILQLAFEEDCEVICIQEPYTHPGTRTSNHPAYACFAPVDSWENTDPEQRELERPRVMTYVRKGTGIHAQQHRSVHSRDLLWVSVNGFPILNAYRQPITDTVIEYVISLTPPANCLIGGDFNA